MEKIGLEFLKSIKNYSEIDLKPITIFLGKNSSGKSSFLRTLPLLKQTINESTAEPILWYGNQVDFGSFEESITSNISNTINFSYVIRTNLMDVSNSFMFYEFKSIANEKRLNNEYTKVKFGVSEKFIEFVEINFFNNTLKIKYNNDSTIDNIVFNNERILAKNEKLSYLKVSNSLIPRIFLNEIDGKSKSINALQDRYLNFITQYFQKIDPALSGDKVKALIKELGFCDSNKIIEFFNKKRLKKSFKDKFSSNLLNPKESLLFYKGYILYYLNSLIEYINMSLNFEFNSIHYSKPLRVQVDRYYRVSGISTDYVDSSGYNLPMILSKLTKKEQENFDDFTKKYLGCSFSVKNESGHTSLNVLEIGNTRMFNVADVGFGYSQVLPIVLSIWKIISSKNDNFEYNSINEFVYRIGLKKNFIQVIEQPELHLHPAFQAKIIDMFADMINLSINSSKFELKFLFETHSETMINRLGYLISKKKLDRNLVNIVIFSKDDFGYSLINQTGYDEKGFLVDWPLGFFTPEGI